MATRALTEVMTSSPVHRRILIATLGPGSLEGLASALVGAGHSVTVLADSSAHDQEAASAVQHFTWNPATRASAQQSVDAAVAASGEPDLLVLRVLPDAASLGREVVQTDDVQWRAICGSTMLQLMHLLQCLAAPLQRQHAAIVFVGPSLSLVGAAGLAGLVALLESQRGLVKSLARQWGKHGVTVNWLALDARELWPDFDRFRLPARTEAVPVALGRRPDAASDLGGVVDFLGGNAGRVVTGATIALDGGEWMVP
jgi:3-oxoacyl-[acyl-carrier protein] reductase